MNRRMMKKGEVIAAIALLLLSGLIAVEGSSALEPRTGRVSVVVIYQDAFTHATDFLSEVKASLYDINGNLVDEKVSTPLVRFDDVEYGVYMVRIDPIKIGAYVFDAGYALIKVGPDGTTRLEGGIFDNITLVRYALSSEITLKLTKGGEDAEGEVYIYSHNSLLVQAEICGDHLISNSSKKATFNVTFPAVIKVIYNEGGVKETYYTVVDSSGTINIELSDYTKIWGMVRDSSGSIVSEATRITLAKKSNDEPLFTFTSQDGTFSFYLRNDEYSSYYLTVTADGYGIARETPTESLMNIELNPVETSHAYSLQFSDNLNTLTLNYIFEVLESTVIQGLPYSEYGVLDYQMRLLGLSEAELINYMENRVKEYTNDFVSVDGNIYELKSKSTSYTPITKYGEDGYRFNIKATYTNDEINKEKMLKDGSINLLLYASSDKVVGTKRTYEYTILLPDDLQRSNEVDKAKVEGYVNSITISDVENTPITLVIKERKEPKLYLDPVHFKFGWENMENREYVVNQSSENYTIVMPANTNVWFNASSVVYDTVRDKVDWRNTTYLWSLDSSTLASGEGVANVSAKLSEGKHTLKLKVTDVGENSNETEINILADSCWPTANIVIKDPSGKVLAKINETLDLKSVKYEIGESSGSVEIENNLAVISATLVVNESEEIVYDATSSYDTYDGVHKVTLPLNVEWSFNGENSTGINKTYAFEKPSRNGTYSIEVRLQDAVGNNLTIKFSVKVEDITKPVVKMKMLSEGKEVSEIKEGEEVLFDASESYDPDNGTIASWSWSIKDSKYQEVNSTVYDLLNGSFSSDKLELKFKEYGTYYIILNVSDEDGNYAVLNRSIHVTPVRPDLGINTVEVKGDKVEGKQLTFQVNVTNNGNRDADVYYIALIVKGKEVANESFTSLANGSYAIQSVTWTPDSPGKYKVTVKVYCSGEPSSYSTDNEKKVDVTVNQAAWKTPAIVIGVIAVIGIIGYIGWVAQKKRKEGKKFTKRTKSKKKEKK